MEKGQKSGLDTEIKEEIIVRKPEIPLIKKTQTNPSSYKPGKMKTARESEASKLVRCIQLTNESFAKAKTEDYQVIEVYICPTQVLIGKYVKDAKERENRIYETNVLAVRDAWINATLKSGVRHIHSQKCPLDIWIYYYSVKDKEEIYKIELDL